jgi:hypothetical protein
MPKRKSQKALSFFLETRRRSKTLVKGVFFKNDNFLTMLSGTGGWKRKI